MSGHERDYLCDEMLGVLARWLRMLGHNVEYARGMSDAAILNQLKQERRFLLTRDKQMAQGVEARGLYIRSPDLDRQLAQLRDELGLRFNEGATRCSSCNTKLHVESKEEAALHVPHGALESSSVFFRCPGCGRHYWDGTHWKSIVERAEKLGLRRL